MRLRDAVHLIRRLRRQLPLIGEAFGVRSVEAEQSPAPTTRDTTLSRKKVQTSKSGLHLLLTANIQRHLLANLVPAYQAARSKKLVR